MFDYSGAFHIHSSYSYDGNVEIKDIINSARKCGLDFIVISDHFNLDAKRDGWEGWHDGIFVLVGEEITPRYNHYLAMDIEKPVLAQNDEDKPQKYIDEVKKQGGFGLISHPDHTGAPKFGIKDYCWKDWNVEGYTGISVWDLMTDWQEKLSSIPRAMFSYIFPSYSLGGPKKETINRWDELSKSRKVMGYGEIDNHNSIKKYFGMKFKIFPFDYAFKTIRTHILTKKELSSDNKMAKTQIINAIKACRAYIAQESWAKSNGLNFCIENEELRACIGETIRLNRNSARLEVRVPRKALIKVICNGKTVYEEKSDSFDLEIKEEGFYRVEAFYRKNGFYKPWIFTNPIWVEK